jgi:hypothetical protein
MTLSIPKMVVLDSATLGKVSRDYWNQDACSRDKARSFITRLQYLGVFVAFTLTHIIELLRHGDEQVVRDRLRFLPSIPLIAWLRPYDRNWFPSGIPDLLLRELHVVVHGSARNWCEIVDAVRPELWETGMGSEMFVDNDEFWSAIKRESNRLNEKQKYVASMARIDIGKFKNMKVSEVLLLPIRPKEERGAYMRRFAQEIQKQLDRHGDKRLDCSHDVAIDFANSTFQDVKAIDEMGGNPIRRLLESVDVPLELVPPEMTCEEFGELAVYAERLKMISKSLRPPIELTMRDVPLDTLPSYVLERKLASIQSKAERVSGSDLGDRHIAPLIFYTDGIEVDKRTYEFLNQVRRNEPKLASLMGRFFSSSDYSQIPELFDE